jgi:hypothetical protein
VSDREKITEFASTNRVRGRTGFGKSRSRNGFLFDPAVDHARQLYDALAPILDD